MSHPRDDRQDDLFRPSLEKIINLCHPLVRLATEIDWDFLAARFSSVCRLGPGQPPLPTRLVAGLLILKHMHNLSDEALCDRWVENPYLQYFCGEVVFRHDLPFDRSHKRLLAASAFLPWDRVHSPRCRLPAKLKRAPTAGPKQTAPRGNRRSAHQPSTRSEYRRQKRSARTPA